MILYLAIAAVVLSLVCLVLLILTLVKLSRVSTDRISDAVADEVTQREALALSTLKTDLVNENRDSRLESSATVQHTMRSYSEAQTTTINQQFRTFTEQNTAALEAIRATVQGQLEVISKDNHTQMDQMRQTVDEKLQQNNSALETIRTTVQGQLETLQKDNHSQLDQMRQTVDEKLQKTLDDRISQSFQLVNERLQEVYTGLGEMKTLASGVGDLKKVLSNVKTRGILGEYQLGAIIREILTPEQYAENVATVTGSANRVEFAVRLPGESGGGVWLPIDSKFPGDTYAALVDAYETADPAQVAAAQKELVQRIKGCAKDIRDKYIAPPDTTDFGIMFLPFEGLYAEVVRMGLVEALQREYKVNIAGPTTLAALLNSLQMGFRTLAIQKRSGEVWNVLGAVKTEFATFGKALEDAQKRINQTSVELDKLVGTRTRAINRKLKDVSELPAEESRTLLGSDAEYVVEE